jgi:RNA polymerase-binding transcription factor
MTEQDLQYFKTILQKKEQELLKNIAYLKDVVMNSTTQEASGDHSAYSFHMADQGTDAMEREKAFLFASRDEKYLKQIEAAYLRIADGSFGICRSCQKEISKERLEAVPTTTICFECKSKETK